MHGGLVRALTPGLGLLLAAAAVACSQGQIPANPASPSAALPSVSSTLSSHGGGKLPPTISVTTILGDVDSYGVAADIASDGGGPYVDNVAGVTSYLTANGYNGIAYGDWQFLKNTIAAPLSTSRRISFSLDLNDAVLPGDPHYTAPANPPFWGAGALVSHMEVKCTLLSKSMLTMTAGSLMTCPLLPAFTTSAGVDYGLGLSHSFTGFPETTDIQIVCNAVDTVGCKDWFMDPIASLGQAGVARLTSTSKHGGTVDDGDFYIRFHFHITRP
jgi:hypothetical protein